MTSPHASITIVKCYAPTNDSSDVEKDQFYYTLKIVVDGFPTMMLMLMGYLNAKIGNENACLESEIGMKIWRDLYSFVLTLTL